MACNVEGREKVDVRTFLSSLTSISKTSDPACFLFLCPGVAVLLGSIGSSPHLLYHGV
jgi:hypothetical protein